ncbi:MFS transporter [Flavobacterium silvisoli]|uniref:MFS transporter n=1 Tax=Flavobacterium silvisoli TaxID=2529433 RepID=A0A4Q9Z355_9FLAO|nr:MFS transporter [Flavobacterium silvisoli]TBX68804.1 MFS transporter [Flavobacterium silvisoli]
MPLLPKGHPKLLNAWAFYDWANSVYSLVIASAVFPIFYNALFDKSNPYIVVFGHNFKNSALISFVTAAAFLCVALFSPLLSGIADYMGNKKIFMRVFNYIGALSCIGLYFFDLENILLGLTFYFFGLIGFWGSLVFYNSYLPDIAYPEQQDKVSAKGYSLGYVGSVLLLIINLAMIMKPELFHITGTPGEASMKAMRYSFATVGIWWIVFSKYTYFYLPKGNSNQQKVTTAVIFNGFRELKKVWKMLQSEVPLKRYLLSFFVFSMAVQTVMLVATYFGSQEIEWSSPEESQIGLITCILLIQLIAIAGAVLTSRASAKYGNVKVLIVLNAFWVLLCGFAYFITTPTHFYIMAALVGLVMGGIQALGRSTYSKFLPETEDTASFFSFYDVSEKIGIVIGMLVYGLIDQITGSPRFAIVFLGVFFMAGLLLLLRIPRKSLA